MNNHPTWLQYVRGWGRAALLVPLFVAAVVLLTARSQAADNAFNIQVSPSPLVVNLTPGQSHTATLTVRNLGTQAVNLTPSLSGVKTDAKHEHIELTDDIPLGLHAWISFKQSSLVLAPGQSLPLEITYNTPQDVGFSYILAIKLSSPTNGATEGTSVEAQVAVFNLVTINRPDAKRELAIEQLKSTRSRYEFLPATFELTVKNNGNVIDQPSGTLFIQRSFNDNNPIAAIPINKAAGYILPESSRTFSNNWQEGFPAYTTYTEAGVEKTKLTWDFSRFSNLRMGKYVAKAVLVYNDGQRDIPVVASTTFWVIPWRLLAVAVVLGGLVATGLVVWGRAVLKGTKKVSKYAARR